MDNKLIITSKKIKRRNYVVSSRLTNELVEQLDKIAEQTVAQEMKLFRCALNSLWIIWKLRRISKCHK